MSADGPATERLLNPGSNCWRIATAERVSAIVDAADYFAAFAEACRAARRQILILGWDFDRRERLHRDQDPGGDLPDALGSFLAERVRRSKGLRVYLLSWDFKLLRLLPIAPFAVFNLVAGASHLGFRQFIVGSLVGMAPGLGAITLFSGTLWAAVSEPTWGNAAIAGAVGLGLILFALLARRIGNTPAAAMLLGDLNLWSGVAVPASLAAVGFRQHLVRSFPTWPAPVAALDRILVRQPLVISAWRHESAPAPVASDHFPVVAELCLQQSPETDGERR